MAFNNAIASFGLGVANQAIAGGGLIGNLIQGKKNRKLQRETNALNYKMFKENQAYQKTLWDQSNVYNSPIEQRKRLQEAGFNPYVAMDNGTVSSGISDVMDAGTPPEMQAPQYDLNSFNQSIQGLARSFDPEQYSKILENQKLSIETSYLAQEKLAALVNLAADTDVKKNSSIGQQIANDVAAASKQADITTRLNQAMITTEQVQMFKNQVREGILRNTMLEIDATNYPDRYKAELASIVADTVLKNSQHLLADAQTETEINYHRPLVVAQTAREIAQKYEAYCRANNLNVDSAFKSAITDPTVLGMQIANGISAVQYERDGARGTLGNSFTDPLTWTSLWNGDNNRPGISSIIGKLVNNAREYNMRKAQMRSKSLKASKLPKNAKVYKRDDKKWWMP